ncbi:MAG: (2Fe-2S)-binding protein [Bacteroidetes bacterium]|nr:(2Fe-2S)-binding protein [Bacteroidota bacterium]
MSNFKLSINGKSYQVDVEEDMPLLWVVRDYIGLTGSKFGCGIMQCGACTMHLNGEPVFSCSTPITAAVGKKITTIEGLSEDSSHPVQQAWIAEQVPQCGYCQSGQIMRAAWLLEQHPKPTDGQIDEAMSAHICRCGTYDRVRKAIHRAAGVDS